MIFSPYCTTSACNRDVSHHEMFIPVSHEGMFITPKEFQHKLAFFLHYKCQISLKNDDDDDDDDDDNG